MEGTRGPDEIGSGRGCSRFAKAECRLEAHIRRTKLSHSRWRTESARLVKHLYNRQNPLKGVSADRLLRLRGSIRYELPSWDRKVLREKDNLLEAANQRFRD